MNPTNVTQLLQRAAEGDLEASGKAWDLVSFEIDKIAQGVLRKEKIQGSIQASDLCQEAFLRIFGTGNAPSVNDRKHFFRIAAQHMRRTIVDRHRRKFAKKRGGIPLSLEGQAELVAEAPDSRIVELNEALLALAQLDEVASAVVEMRFFAGYSVDHTAEILSISKAAVKEHFDFAKAWLFDRMRGNE